MKGIKSCSGGGNSLYLPTRHRQVPSSQHSSCQHLFLLLLVPFLLFRHSQLRINTHMFPSLCSILRHLNCLFSSFYLPFFHLVFLPCISPQLKCTACRTQTSPPINRRHGNPTTESMRRGRKEGRKTRKKEREQERKSLFRFLRLNFNGVIKWLETDRNNKNRAWQREGSGG